MLVCVGDHNYCVIMNEAFVNRDACVFAVCVFVLDVASVPCGMSCFCMRRDSDVAMKETLLCFVLCVIIFQAVVRTSGCVHVRVFLPVVQTMSCYVVVVGL